MSEAKSKANDRQVGGDHYKAMPIQPWDFTLSNRLGHAEATAIEYIARWRQKGGFEDLRKAQHWIEKLIECETNGYPSTVGGAGGGVKALRADEWPCPHCGHVM